MRDTHDFQSRITRRGECDRQGQNSKNVKKEYCIVCRKEEESGIAPSAVSHVRRATPTFSPLSLLTVDAAPVTRYSKFALYYSAAQSH